MSTPFPFPGPIAPESNPRIHPEYYAPSRVNIAALSLGATTIVTTDVDHEFVIGQLVRLLIPEFFGSYQISKAQGYVLSVPSSTQVEVGIDSKFNVNAFIASPPFYITKAQIVPIGDVNTGSVNSSGRVNVKTYIPGSFVNISPN